MRPVMDALTGERFGRLIAIAPTNQRSCRSVVWLCKCDCGNEILVSRPNLKKGFIKSCGCLRKAVAMKNGKNKLIPNQGASFNSLYHNYKFKAEKRGLSFSLTEDEFRYITKSNCFYCNRVPEQEYYRIKSKDNSYIYNGIDRVDNSRGYEINNCVACCKKCNAEKNSISVEMCRKVIEFIDRKEK